jgi:hypothetical protein
VLVGSHRPEDVPGLQPATGLHIGRMDRRAVKGRMDRRENDWNTLVIACGCGFWG